MNYDYIESQCVYIQKHNVNDVNKIAAKIQISKYLKQHFQLCCCVPGHPEKLVILQTGDQRNSLILVDFDNPQVLNVILQGLGSVFAQISVGPSGKIVVFDKGFHRCYE